LTSLSSPTCPSFNVKNTSFPQEFKMNDMKELLKETFCLAIRILFVVLPLFLLVELFHYLF
jgi:hypothetical protein